MQGGRVLVIGNGGREHAICWKLAQSPKVKDIFVAGNNVGIVAEPKVQKAALDLKDFKGVASWCKQNNIELVVVGPEDPLANGIADVLTSEGVLCFGPKKAAAQIEASKEFAKNFMDKYSIPTAKWKSFTSAKEAKEFIRSGCFPSVVVKASGLAAGKGVIVASSAQEAEEAVDSILVDSKFGAAGETVVIEEFLKGDEVSVLAFTDGSNVKLMVPAQDHKRILDDDQGLNTGGMGAYAPCPLLTENTLRLIEETVLQRTVLGLKKENTPFVGVLYAGLMLTSDGPKVLEFNCRFGDPETQVILPLLESDLYDIIKACCTGNLCSCDLKWKAATSAVGVVLSSAGYPETSTKGKVITGLDEVSKLRGHYVFHSGTDIVNGNVVTNGGRVLIAVVLSPTLILAAAKAQLACKKISFEGAHYRKDIAFKGIARSLLHEGELTYQKSGVDITAADNLIHNVKPAIESTKRSGVVGSVGGFGGLFDVKASGYTDPLLVSGTDGVGTKLKIAETCGIHSTLGIDLVAMCVNDILTHGAEPLYFLDYYACGALSVDVASQVITGVAKGCKEAGCALIGGETAEMPGIYSGGEYDLAGFAVGAVERSNLLPLTNKIKPGDVLIGLPSSGVHSNGFSLVRRILEKSGKKYSDKAPFSKTGKTFGEELLTPTKIYVKNLIGILKTGKVKALAHITGGGLLENVPRILPKEVRAVFDATQWQILPVYGWLSAVGGVTAKEMLRTFNCGIGMVLVVDSADVNSVCSGIVGEEASVIGKIEQSVGDVCHVEVNNFVSCMEMVMRPYVKEAIQVQMPLVRKRVGVLISGSGTNLQSLINHTTNSLKPSAAEIVLVISNKKDVEGLKRAERANIPTKVIPHGTFSSRAEFDAAVHAALVEAGVEIVCLAGFMRVLGSEFVRNWHGKLINIHPSLLPLFKGTHAHKQALEAGVRVTGCTVHFVVEDIDAGAIIYQESAPIEVGDTEETLQERVKLVEHKAFPKALELLARGKIYVDNSGKIVWKA